MGAGDIIKAVPSALICGTSPGDCDAGTTEIPSPPFDAGRVADNARFPDESVTATCTEVCVAEIMLPSCKFT